MRFKEFLDTISDYEYFSYTHIMEIPELSLAYAKTLNNEQWNLIYREKQSIALCCCIENKVHIIFSNDCYQLVNIAESTKVESGCLIENLYNFKKIIISAPQNFKNKIEYSNNLFEMGQIEIIYDTLNNEKIKFNSEVDLNNNRLEDKYDSVINLWNKHCGLVMLDNKTWEVFKYKYQYFIRYNDKYFFSTDLLTLYDAASILNINLNEKNIDSASFISEDFFYYTTRVNYTNYDDIKCGLINILNGVIITCNSYYGICNFYKNKYFKVSIKNSNNSKYPYGFSYGLIDINGEELLQPIYFDIRLVVRKDNTFNIWLKEEKGSEDWLIYEQLSNKIRKAEEIDFL
jgi:hypothetical protein